MQRKIDALFTDTGKLVQQHLDPEVLERTIREVSQAEAGSR